MIVSAEDAVKRERSRFAIVCTNCSGLSIKVEDPANQPVTTLVLCGGCGAVRGTLGDLQDLARLATDSFEF